MNMRIVQQKRTEFSN